MSLDLGRSLADTEQRPVGPRNRVPWIARDRAVPRVIRGPVRQFLQLEVASGVVLLAATVAALAVANSPAAGAVDHFFERDLTLLQLGGFHLTESLLHWINDGLMALFFFVVGLEIKRELADGELADPTRALLPVLAAIGGMVVPATIYAVLSGGGPASPGWGIPMASDIAFALGVLALLGRRVPSSLRLFLLTLAIVDDIGAILVIAIFYTSDLHLWWLIAASGLLGVVLGLQRLRVWYVPVYVALGVAVWVATLESGVHATIAGVLLGLLTPARPLRPEPHQAVVDEETSFDAIRRIIFEARETIPVAERLQHLMHPWSAFVVLPVFAFANARIEISPTSVADAVTSGAGLGIVAGLVVGKPVGILAFTWLAQRSGMASLPSDASMAQIGGLGMVAGIGFTVSLFITELAFDEPGLVADAKLAVLGASLLAAILGAALLWRAASTARTTPEPL